MQIERSERVISKRDTFKAIIVDDEWVNFLLILSGGSIFTGCLNFSTKNMDSPFASDMFPRKAIGSVVGFGGMAGSVGGILLSNYAGYILDFTGSYMSLFIIAGSVYLIALLIFQLLVPNLEMVEIR